ncbi:MAG: hypothetical protein JWM74_5084 [Myxococcaceae bacterium]|jgi:hypothetical protein|nr:hypothetical protein [Myxococcaceae bacterium]
MTSTRLAVVESTAEAGTTFTGVFPQPPPGVHSDSRP